MASKVESIQNAQFELDKLAEIQAQLDALNLAKQEMIEAQIPPEVKKAIDDIEAEFAAKINQADQQIDELKEDIKKFVLANGETIKGSHIRAQYNRGKITYRTDAMEVFAEIHPEIKKFRKEGDPYVSFVNI